MTFGGDWLPYLIPGEGPGWHFSPTWKARDHRGNLYLTAPELALGTSLAKQMGGFILLEPAGRDRRNRNRCWPHDRWLALAKQLMEIAPWPVLQLGHPDAELLGIPLVEHVGFREACGILHAARLIVCPEGGLAHAAASLGVPAVVLWGGCISAEALGYPEHVNLVFDDPRTPCGMVKPCTHCVRAWQRLTVEDVITAAEFAVGRMDRMSERAGVQ
jgi:ADP-heptose:LPS heptosyltransferase